MERADQRRVAKNSAMKHTAMPQRSKWVPLALGATLGVAGLYQFTTLKHICLSRCRSPLAFVAQHWRHGRVGALKMGLRHGLYCFGCCWTLFAVLVATGVMSVAWVLLLTLLVFVEKLHSGSLYRSGRLKCLGWAAMKRHLGLLG